MAHSSLVKATCLMLFGWLLLSIPMPGLAQGIGKVKSKAPPKEDKIPPDLTPEKVDGYLAGLSDEQARRLFAGELKERTAEKSGKASNEFSAAKESGLVLAFFSAQRALSSLRDQLDRTITGAGTPTETEVRKQLVGGDDFKQFLISAMLLVFILLLGWSAERLLLHKTERLRSQLLEQIPHGGWEKTGIFLSRLILDCFGIAAYVLVTFLAYFVIHDETQPAYLISSALIVTYYFRFIELAARLITSPKIPELRLVFMSDSNARFVYNWIIWITLSVMPVSALALALEKSGANRELFLLVYSTAGPIISALLAVMIWQARQRVAKLVCPLEAPDSIPAWLLRQRCADYWHYPAIVFVLVVGGYWWARALTHPDVTILRLILSIFLVPLCIGMDQWLQQMLVRLGGKPRDVIDFATPDEDAVAEPVEHLEKASDRQADKNMSIYFPLIRKTFRVVLLFFLIFGALQLWGVDLDFGWIFARNILGVVIALVLGLIAWEVIKARIDQKIREGIPLESDEAEEGGSGGSRSGTLLLLLRKFIMAFLIVVIGFSVLASLGVDIAPLLAGAGVIGLAIGFGSQTLVKDIIAGVFFLIDDAFRLGDYVEAGTAKGTVEHISLRSLRLRHPRGQIFVVPFGDLKTVQNFTRDYIIEKLDIRVRYDTDPDEIRKIIKKINKDITGREELAKSLLSDIKSAGVRAMDDSAMIMRVKFKCVPGEQFLVRREVFRQIQKAFKEQGIEFAHRNVTVYLPPQPAIAGGSASAGGVDQKALIEAAGAAAAIAQDEAAALAQSAKKKE